MEHNNVPRSDQQRQQQQRQQLLQPLFDSSISLPHDGIKASSSNSSSNSPPDPNPQQQQLFPPGIAGTNSGVFGRLPPSAANATRLDNALISHMHQQPLGGTSSSLSSSAGSNTASSSGHARTASYGTTLLDTLNEEKQQHYPASLHYQRAAAAAHHHQRHYSLMGDAATSTQQQQQQPPSLSVSPPIIGTTAAAAGANRLAAHVRAHTLTTAPASILLRQPMASSSSNPLGTSNLLGTSAQSLAAAATAAGGGNSLLSSSALRSSYSSSSLRAAFGSRNTPSPLGGGISGDSKITAASIGAAGFDFSTSLDEGVWGPSGLSNELDLLATSVEGMSVGNSMGASTASGGDAYARIRSYSFNSPPEGDDGPDGPDIDVLHAAAKAQNPSLAFRKLMARTTHARSKTLASPLSGGGGSGATHTHSRQPSQPDANIGIGGESMRAFTRTTGSIGGGVDAHPSHSRQPSADFGRSRQASSDHNRQASDHNRQPSTDFSSRHNRQPSADFDFPPGDGVPTRSLWVGNVDPRLSSHELAAQFGKYGRVESLRLLPDKECAFVNFLRVEDAISAREDMHAGARIGASTVRVGYGKGEAHASGDAQAMQPTRALWIGNIAAHASPDSLAAVFRPFGAIESARVLNHKNCGFVNFVRLEDAVRAKQAVNGKSIDGSVVRIGYAKVPAAKNEPALKLRNPVPSAAPLTASGQRAEDAAIAGTAARGLRGDDAVLEPGFTLAVDEDLVAFSYATELPRLDSIRGDSIRDDAIKADSIGAESSSPLSQTRLRDIRKLLDANQVASSQPEFDSLVRELLPHAVDLCTDYVGNVLVQKIAERGDAAQRLALARRVGPHMAAIGAHKNGTWAVQKIVDTAADSPEAVRRVVVQSIRPYAPQLLLDQLGNYVVQGCLKFGAPSSSDSDALSSSDAAISSDASNQFVFDAIHARCVEIAQGRFGARAIRTCLESPHATRQQQKLVAVALVTNAVALATNANGHLLMNWLLDSSKFAGRFRVLAHQLAPHLRYLATHKLGASTVTKLVDQTAEPDARDLILNTLFFNPDPTVLDDLLVDQAQGVHLVLKILQGNAIGDAEKARIADRLRFILEKSAAPAASVTAPTSSSSSSPSSSSSLSSSTTPPASSSPAAAVNGSSNVPPSQRLADVVAGILAHSQPVYPPTMPPAAHRSTAAVPQQQIHESMATTTTMTTAATLAMPFPHAPTNTAAITSPPHAGFHFMPHMMSNGSHPTSGPSAAAAAAAGAMSYPATGYGGMVAGSYYMDPLSGMMAAAAAPAGFFGIDYSAAQQQQQQNLHHHQQQQQQQQRASAMPYYLYHQHPQDMSSASRDHDYNK